MEGTIPDSRKVVIRLIGGLFIGLLISFTLLGNTLQSLSLPKVTTVIASSGQLEHAFKGNAVIQPGLQRELSNPAGWKVLKVSVKRGEQVAKGQALVEYSDSEAQQQLADARNSLQKLQLSMEQLEFQFKEAATGEDAAAKMSARLAIETAKLDISAQQQHIESLVQKMEQNRILRAPFNGIVSEIHAVEGLGPAGDPDVVLASVDTGFLFQLTMPQSIAAYLNIGDDIDVLRLSKDNLVLTGKITGVKDAGVLLGDAQSNGTGGQKDIAAVTVTVTLKDKRLKAGDQVQVNLTEKADKEQTLLDSKAVRTDSEGTYVYTIESKQGPISNTYTVVRTPVKVIDSNDHLSAVEGLFDEQEAVLESSDFVNDGTRVRH